jgi:aryl-alcohol dehydrogenase-like predicted oxidoreductase
VSELGFGCQSLGGGLYHRHDAESVTMLQRALDAGVNFFDSRLRLASTARVR